MTDHIQEIHNTRVGGFGGSDAAIFHRIGTRGIEGITETDRRRILVAKDVIPYQPISSTTAMEAGHMFEEYVSDLSMLDAYSRECVLSVPMSSKFSIFAHADFLGPANHVVECKFSQKNTSHVMMANWAQLQWYYMLGARKVQLCHGHGQVDPFIVHGITMTDVDRDNEYIEALVIGVQILSDNWESIGRSELREDITIEDLLPFEQRGVAVMTSALQEIKHLEKRAAEQREKLLSLFEKHNIKSLKSDSYTITYVGPTIRKTLDKNALRNAHPDIKLSDFEKTSNVKSLLKITLK